MHPDTSPSTGDAEEAAVKRALHARAAKAVVLASPEKLMAASSFVVARLSELRLLVAARAARGRRERAEGLTCGPR